MKGKIWITGDLWLGQKDTNIALDRGYKTASEHDSNIVRRFNLKVGPNDNVIILGNIFVNDTIAVRQQIAKLNGNIVWVRGEMDTDDRIAVVKSILGDRLLVVDKIYTFAFHKWTFICSHYPSFVDLFENDDKFYCLHSHWPAEDPEELISYCCYNCGWEVNDDAPVLLEDVICNIKRAKKAYTNVLNLLK